jgi:hypothetical protein
MARAAVRAAWWAALTFLVWVLPRAAWAASAPLCDDRGATAVAAPPLLQASDEGSPRAGASSSCEDARSPRCAHIAPCRGSVVAIAQISEAGLAGRSIHLARDRGQLDALAFSVVDHPRGVRSRVERPPRGASRRGANVTEF